MTMAVAVILYAWATTQMTLAELGQPTERPRHEVIEPGVPEWTGPMFDREIELMSG